jgi:hypothetical protein
MIYVTIIVSFILGTAAQPLGVAVIDAAVALFPVIFARAANKHR